jgi:hypothetical protein
MIICPDAEPDDGLFDVLTIGDLTKRDLLVTLPKTYRGSHLPHPKAELRGAVVTIDADAPLPVELDGEQPGTTPVRFEIVPGRCGARPRGLGRGLAELDRLARGGFLFDAGFAVAATCFASFATPSRARRGRAASSASRRAGSSNRSSCRRTSSRPAVRELVQRLVPELREASEDVVLLGRARLRHDAMVPRHVTRQRTYELSFLRHRRLRG